MLDPYRFGLHDPLWSSVGVYLDWDYGSTNNGTTLVERGPSSHTYTPRVNAKTTTGGLYGTTLSGDFAGDESEWDTPYNATDFGLGGTTYCVEGTAKTTTTGSTKIMVSTRPGFATANGWELRINQSNAGDVCFVMWNGGSTTLLTSAGGTIAANTTFDWAVNRNGSGAGSLVMYINGTSVTSGSPGAIGASSSSTDFLTFGKEQQDTGRSWTGRMYRFRLTNASRYSGNYTPATWIVG